MPRGALWALLAAASLSSGEASSTGLHAPPVTSSEDDLKSAFLLHFPSYVEWPSSTGAETTFCVLGNDAVGDSLERMAGAGAEGKKSVRVRRLKAGQVPEGCAVLFLGGALTADLLEALSLAAGKPVLTVGEADGFIQERGIIRLYREESRLRFEINPDAADAAGLKVSSRLLTLARIVRRRPRRER